MRPAKPTRQASVRNHIQRLGGGSGAKSKGALYRETLQTTGFYMGRIVIVPREFAPIPSPPLRCHRLRELSQLPECVLGRHAESIGPMGGQNYFPNRAGAASRWSAPRLGGPPRELMMTSLSRLLSFPELFQNARALVKRFFRHRGIPRSDVSSHLFTPGPLSRFRSGRCQGIGHAGKNMPCPSSAMSSGRLFLDRVARQHCPSPLHRHPQITMHLFPAEGKGDISTLQRRGHFYFALTDHPSPCHRKVIMSPLSKVEMSS